MNIGFITSEDFADLIPTEQAFTAYAESCGVNIKPVIWNGEIDYNEFDFLIIRTPWDYFIKINEFNNWLDKIENGNVKIWNPMKVIRSNIHKFYLSDLSSEGIEIFPTVFIKQGSDVNIREEMNRNGWDKAVIKPAISGGAYKTHLIDIGSNGFDYSLAQMMIQENDVLLQKYSELVSSAGEWSLIFFNKKYSHSVLKKTAENDFRVQSQFGGKYMHIETPAYLIKQAEEIVNRTEETLLYARVDGVDNKGRLQLMELELIEPDLFLETELAKKNFMEAILALNK